MINFNVELTRAFRLACADVDAVHEFVELLYQDHPRWDDFDMLKAARLEKYRKEAQGGTEQFFHGIIRKLLVRGVSFTVRGQAITMRQHEHTMDRLEVACVEACNTHDYYPGCNVDDIIQGIRSRLAKPGLACALGSTLEEAKMHELFNRDM